MGACFHIAGVTCDNCGMVDRRVIYSPNIGPRVEGDLLGAFDPTPREWTAHPPAIYAEVAALRAEVARLTTAVKGLQAIKHLRDCRSCRRWVTFTAEQLIGGWLRCPHCDIGATPDEWEPK